MDKVRIGLYESYWAMETDKLIEGLTRLLDMPVLFYVHVN